MLGFDVEVVNNDAVDRFIAFIEETTDASRVCRNSALVRFCGATYEVMLAPSLEVRKLLRARERRANSKEGARPRTAPIAESSRVASHSRQPLSG